MTPAQRTTPSQQPATAGLSASKIENEHPGTLVPPVMWDDEHHVFVVSGFAEANAVLRGTGWSSEPARSPLAPPEMSAAGSGTMLFRDPPDHTRLRRLVAPAFSARAVESLRPRVAAIVESCLDGLADGAGPDGETDLLAEYAYLIPLAVIAELLDVGVEGAEVFLEQTPRLVKLLEVDPSPDDVTDAVAAALEVTMFLTPVLSSRRGGTRGDDFISALLATELTLDEVLSTVVLLLAAGHETTANLIGSGALALLQQPEQRPLLFADPARAIEELIRVHGPVKLIGRTALVDQELDGVAIAAGQAVLLRLDAAGADPRRWDNPGELDLSRFGPAHLGFGTGIHFCLGAALARMEAIEALTGLFQRYPFMSPIGAPRWRQSSTFHGLERLDVRLR
jgi:cytochrome P450